MLSLSTGSIRHPLDQLWMIPRKMLAKVGPISDPRGIWANCQRFDRCVKDVQFSPLKNLGMILLANRLLSKMAKPLPWSNQEIHRSAPPTIWFEIFCWERAVSNSTGPKRQEKYYLGAAGRQIIEAFDPSGVASSRLPSLKLNALACQYCYSPWQSWVNGFWIDHQAVLCSIGKVSNVWHQQQLCAF